MAITSAATSLLGALLPEWHLLLQEWSASSRLTAAAPEALLLNGEPKALTELTNQWAAGDFGALPPIVLLSSADINGALGAYALSTGTIYLNADWLAGSSKETVFAVLTEELGHHLDGVLNSADTPGDEGEHFSNMLNKYTARIDELRADDGGILFINSVSAQVEFALPASTSDTANIFNDNTSTGFLYSYKYESSQNTVYRTSLEGSVKSTVLSGLTSQAQITNLTNGGYAATWATGSSSTDRVLLQLFNELGQATSSVITVSSAAGKSGLSIETTGDGQILLSMGGTQPSFGSAIYEYYRFSNTGSLLWSGSYWPYGTRIPSLTGLNLDLGTNGSIVFAFSSGAQYGALEALCIFSDQTVKQIGLGSGTSGSSGFSISSYNAVSLSDGRVAVVTSYSGGDTYGSSFLQVIEANGSVRYGVKLTDGFRSNGGAFNLAADLDGGGFWAYQQSGDYLTNLYHYSGNLSQLAGPLSVEGNDVAFAGADGIRVIDYQVNLLRAYDSNGDVIYITELDETAFGSGDVQIDLTQSATQNLYGNNDYLKNDLYNDNLASGFLYGYKYIDSQNTVYRTSLEGSVKSTVLSGLTSQAQITNLTNGGYAATWATGSSSTDRVLLQLFNELGQATSSVITVSSAAGKSGLSIETTGDGQILLSMGGTQPSFGSAIYEYYRFSNTGSLLWSGSYWPYGTRIPSLTGLNLDLGTNGSIVFAFSSGAQYGALEALCIFSDQTVKQIGLGSGTSGSSGFSISSYNAVSLSDGRVAVVTSYSGGDTYGSSFLQVIEANGSVRYGVKLTDGFRSNGGAFNLAADLDGGGFWAYQQSGDYLTNLYHYSGNLSQLAGPLSVEGNDVAFAGADGIRVIDYQVNLLRAYDSNGDVIYITELDETAFGSGDVSVDISLNRFSATNNGDAVFSISGTPAVGNTLSATTTTADPDGNGSGGFTYSWQTSSNGTNWSNVGTNSASYTVASADEGKQIQLVVSYTDAQNFSESVTTSAGSIPFVDNGDAVFSISGTPAVGNTLSAQLVSNDPDGNGTSGFTATWQSSIDGVTWFNVGSGPSYQLIASDEGKKIQLQVTYVDGQGVSESIAVSAGTAPYVNNGAGTIGAITGNSAFNEGVALTAGSISGDPDGNGTVTAYQWFLNNTVIGGATSSTLNTSPTGFGTYKVQVTYTDGQEFSSTVTSADQSVAKIDNAQGTLSAITGNGVFQEGVTLTAGAISSDPDGNGNVTAYQWFRNGAAISGATSASYLVPFGGAGSYTVSLTYSDGQAHSTTLTSAVQSVTAPPPPSDTTAPTLSSIAVRALPSSSPSQKPSPHPPFLPLPSLFKPSAATTPQPTALLPTLL